MKSLAKNIFININTKHLLLLMMLFGSHYLSAKIKLPQLISDRMVLQRDAELKIWGWADEGEKVTVRFQNKYYDSEPDTDGKWSVILPPQNAGGPFVMEINEIIIRDILIGDVWLCGGQSNQETPINRLVDMFPEINVSNNHMIRHYKVPSQESNSLECEIADDEQWNSAIASDVMKWTSLAYFYAQEAYEYTQVPQGMIVSSKGGTAIESWISQEYLKEFPKLIIDQEALEGLKEAKKDKGSGKWNVRDFDDSDWKKMQVPGTWKKNEINVKGIVWHRKDFDLPTSMAGKHAKLYMGTLIDSDSVFVNGSFVGSTSYTYPPRKYDIPAGILREGKNNITMKLTSSSGNGEFIEDKPYKLVGDDITIDLTGTWKYQIGLNMEDIKQYRERLNNLKSAGSSLYNGMIYPIRDYKVKGTIWYQGESNTDSTQEYGALLNSLINNWRDLWDAPQMPFMLVQLPNFLRKNDHPSESRWAEIREAQFKTAQTVPHTALAVTYDIGEWNDIHPLNKKDIAHRLFLGARKLVYGDKVISSGPVYKDMKVEGDKITLTFTEIGNGLVSRGGILKHFAIAGNDKKFVWANARIKGNKVIVSSPEIRNPEAVRYGWSNNPEEANLCNKEGLLASPFRTDNW